MLKAALPLITLAMIALYLTAFFNAAKGDAPYTGPLFAAIGLNVALVSIVFNPPPTREGSR